jgi:hypothetical protein
MLLNETHIKLNHVIFAQAQTKKASGAIFDIEDMAAVREAFSSWDTTLGAERISFTIDDAAQQLTFTGHRAPNTNAGESLLNKHLALNIIALVLSDDGNIGSISDMKGMAGLLDITKDEIQAKRAQYGVEATSQAEHSASLRM